MIWHNHFYISCTPLVFVAESHLSRTSRHATQYKSHPRWSAICTDRLPVPREITVPPHFGAAKMIYWNDNQKCHVFCPKSAPMITKMSVTVRHSSTSAILPNPSTQLKWTRYKSKSMTFLPYRYLPSYYSKSPWQIPYHLTENMRLSFLVIVIALTASMSVSASCVEDGWPCKSSFDCCWSPCYVSTSRLFLQIQLVTIRIIQTGTCG
jgi:hypothetical protein